jgi:hypothetical protein
MTSSGLILTNAHLFAAEDTRSYHAHAGNTKSSNTSSSMSSLTIANVRFTGAHGSSSSSSIWLPAKLLHCFQGYLDLAVLQVLPDSLQELVQLHQCRVVPLQLQQPSFAGSSSNKQLGAVQAVHAGQQVFVLGHGLFGPSVGWAPAITAGCAAKVVCCAVEQELQQQQQQQPPAAAAAAAGHRVAGASQRHQKQRRQQGQKPSMVISTAAVHAGASGGALVNAAGELIGLVTSNARHARGTTLPHLNFCISAVELAPMWQWAQQQ